MQISDDPENANALPKKHYLIPNLTDFNDDVDDVDKGVHAYLWQKHRALYLGSWVISGGLAAALLGWELSNFTSLMQNTGNDGRVFIFPSEMDCATRGMSIF